MATDEIQEAMAFAASDFLTIPEWVGLIATDGLAAGRPILTTSNESHAPEIDYLVEGRHRLTASHDTDDYSKMAIRLMKDPAELADLQAQCHTTGFSYSIESMTEAFMEGIRRWVALDLGSN